jgi:hypothetical protein
MDALARSFTESKELVRACPIACRIEESVANSAKSVRTENSPPRFFNAEIHEGGCKWLDFSSTRTGGPAFDLAGATYKVGCPVLRVVCEGREPPTLAQVFITPTNREQAGRFTYFLSHEAQSCGPFSASHFFEPGCPILSRFLRKGGNQ